jgi:hypothetical protein
MESTVRTTEVCVLLTSVEETRSALRVAHDLAQAMAASLTLIDLRPTQLPLQPASPHRDTDPRKTAFVERLRSQGIAVNLRLFVCQDEWQAIPLAFRPHSLIIVGAKRSWLPTRTERLRRSLEAAGHFVMFVDPIDSTEQQA